MKQNITKEQLNELSDKGKEKLREWWTPQIGDHYGGFWSVDGLKDGVLHEDQDGELYLPGGIWLLPAMSIGQMIEFLEDRISSIQAFGDNTPNPKHRRPEAWGVVLMYRPHTPDYKELCDALWEAVKEILEK